MYTSSSRTRSEDRWRLLVHLGVCFEHSTHNAQIGPVRNSVTRVWQYLSYTCLLTTVRSLLLLISGGFFFAISLTTVPPKFRTLRAKGQPHPPDDDKSFFVQWLPPKHSRNPTTLTLEPYDTTIHHRWTYPRDILFQC